MESDSEPRSPPRSCAGWSATPRSSPASTTPTTSPRPQGRRRLLSIGQVAVQLLSFQLLGEEAVRLQPEILSGQDRGRRIAGEDAGRADPRAHRLPGDRGRARRRRRRRVRAGASGSRPTTSSTSAARRRRSRPTTTPSPAPGRGRPTARPARAHLSPAAATAAAPAAASTGTREYGAAARGSVSPPDNSSRRGPRDQWRATTIAVEARRQLGVGAQPGGARRARAAAIERPRPAQVSPVTISPVVGRTAAPRVIDQPQPVAPAQRWGWRRWSTFIADRRATIRDARSTSIVAGRRR